MIKVKEGILSYLTLFTSMGILICCALPALLVSLGLGAVLAGLASKWPSLIWISEHKLQVFIFAGAMLAFNGAMMWMNRNAPCPIDPKLRDACIRGRAFSKWIYIFSVLIFLVGFFFAYLAPAIF
ncbi:hypothetical protein CIK05_10995 [Bdellovibrio sp. qaytius]|nr:hypothetical protein CIK05_10995 [Bdellovibrio sp. qaytius]